MDIRYTKILVAIDGSDHASLAFDHALAIASCCDATLLLTYAYGDIPSVIGGDARASVIKECEMEAQAILAPYEKTCAEKGVKCTLVIRQGRPGRTLVQVASDERCDLIVMGSRGRSEFTEIVLGSVSQRVLSHAHAPVLILR